VDHRNLILPVDGARRVASATKLDDITLPVITEVVYPITNEEDESICFIVCYTRSSVEQSPVKIKFLACIASAALIASTNFHDYSLDDAELDNKNNASARLTTAYGSQLRLDEYAEQDKSKEMGCWSTHPGSDKRVFNDQVTGVL
jgi:hypothetical protein